MLMCPEWEVSLYLKQFTSTARHLPPGKVEMETGSPSPLRREGRKEGRVPIKAVMLRWAPMEPLVLPITAALPLLFLHCGDTSVL